jgi:hypothetical protein
MSNINTLKDKLSRILLKNDPYKDGSSAVPKPDYQDISDKIQHIQKGKERGEQNLPPLGVSSPDEVELQILNTYQEIASKASEDVRTTLTIYNQRLIGFDLSGMLEDIRDICRSSVTDFVAEVTKAKEEITTYRDRVKSKENDLVLFKKENKLIRSASYPDTNDKIFKYGVLLFLFLIETVGNAAFLSKGNELGYLGSYTEAIYISFINIGIAFLVGSLVTRHLFNKARILKFFALVILFFAVMASGAFNLLIAHYREITDSGLFSDAGSLAVQSMSSEPFQLKSIQAWVLFIAGWLFWLIALVDTHKLDDNYPGYGKVSRDAEDSKDEYATFKSEIIDQLKDLKDDSEAEIKDIRDRLGEVQGRISVILNDKNLLQEDYADFTEIVKDQFNQMVQSYRDANRSCRSKAPAWFKESIKLKVPKVNDISDVISLDHINEQVTAGRKALDSSIDEFYQKFEEAVQSIDTIDNLTSKKLNNTPE